MTTDVVMVVYSEHGPWAKAGVTAHRYALVSSITPEFQTKVFDVLENNFLLCDSDNSAVDPAVDFVRYGLYRDLDKIIEECWCGSLIDLLASSMTGAGFWLATRINYPNGLQRGAATFENTFVVPDDWAIKRIYIVNSPRY